MNSLDIQNFLKYSIIFAVLSTIIQGGVVFVTPEHIIQPNELIYNYEKDQGVEIIITELYPMIEQYQYYLDTLSKDYDLLDIIEDKQKHVCYIKVKSKLIPNIPYDNINNQ